MGECYSNYHEILLILSLTKLVAGQKNVHYRLFEVLRL